MFRKVKIIKAEVEDSDSDEPYLSEVDDRTTQRGGTPTSTRATPVRASAAQPRRTLRSSGNARQSTNTSSSKSHPAVNDDGLEDEDDENPTIRSKRRHRVQESPVNTEKPKNKRVRRVSTSSSPSPPARPPIRSERIAEGRRELYNFEKLKLRKLELEMEERRRRETYEREREREKFEVVLKFL